MTEIQHKALAALAKRGPCGPAHLSNFVWPEHLALRKGAAPGTGLVRPMLAVLARLKKAGLVECWSPNNGEDPFVWGINYAGRVQLRTHGVT